MSVSNPEYHLLTKINKVVDDNYNNKRVCVNSYTFTYADLNQWDDYGRIFILEKLPSDSEILDCKVNITSAFDSQLTGYTLDFTIKLSDETTMLSLMTSESLTGKYDSVLTDVLLKDKSLDVILHFANYISPPGWTTTTNLSAVRTYGAGCGLQTAGLAFGGSNNVTYTNLTEEYNGSTWSSSGASKTARHYLAGCGLQDAGLSFGGYNANYSNTTEEYNGSTWELSNILPCPKQQLAGAGTQDAGLSFGGTNANNLKSTAEYNGVTWSSSNDLVNRWWMHAGAGLQDAGLCFGNGTCTEEYNGTNWSTGNNMNSPRHLLAGCGTQTAGLSFGGDGAVVGVTGQTEVYNGISWYIIGGMISPRYGHAGCGTQSAALAFGGNNAGSLISTEEWNYGTPCKLNILNGTTPNLNAGSMDILLAYAYS